MGRNGYAYGITIAVITAIATQAANVFYRHYAKQPKFSAFCVESLARNGKNLHHIKISIRNDTDYPIRVDKGRILEPEEATISTWRDIVGYVAGLGMDRHYEIPKFSSHSASDEVPAGEAVELRWGVATSDTDAPSRMLRIALTWETNNGKEKETALACRIKAQ